MDLFIIHTMNMRHDQFEVITAVRDKRIDEQFSFLIFEHICCLFQQFRVGAGVSGKTTYIRFNNGNCRLWHEKSHYRISLQEKKVTVDDYSIVFLTRDADPYELNALKKMRLSA